MERCGEEIGKMEWEVSYTSKENLVDKSSFTSSPNLCIVFIATSQVSWKGYGGNHDRFFTDSHKGASKWELVSWESTCRPLNARGLGLQPLLVMNNVLISKLIWRLYKKDNRQWSRIRSRICRVLGNVEANLPSIYLEIKLFLGINSKVSWKAVVKRWKDGNGIELH